jgi:hypothetical protein
MIRLIRKLWRSTSGNGEIVATIAAVAVAAGVGYAAVNGIGSAAKDSSQKSSGQIRSF